MKKMHLSVRLLSLLLVLTLLWGVAAPADASGVGSPLEALVPEETPTAGIGYMEEVLKNLVEEATYRIQGSAYQANDPFRPWPRSHRRNPGPRDGGRQKRWYAVRHHSHGAVSGRE